MALLAAMFFIAMADVAQVAEQPGKSESNSSGAFQVKVSKGSLSLQAQEAPLVQILGEIGKQASIMIESNIGPEEKVTTRLDSVPLEEGIRQLAKNVSVVYATSPRDKTKRIERIVVLSEGSGVSGKTKGTSQPENVKQSVPQAAKASKPLPQSEPFKFEFDPAKFGGKEKVGKQP